MLQMRLRFRYLHVVLVQPVLTCFNRRSHEMSSECKIWVNKATSPTNLCASDCTALCYLRKLPSAIPTWLRYAPSKVYVAAPK